MTNSFYDPTLQFRAQYPDPNSTLPKNQNSTDWSKVGTGLAGLGLNTYRMSNQGLHLNQQVGPSQYDLNSAPSYTAGAAQNEADSAKIQGTTGGEILGGAAQGFATAGPIGAFIGVGTAVLGGGLREARQRKEREIALRRVMGTQQTYNNQDVSFRNLQNQREDYLQRINPYNREYAVNQTRF